MKKYIVLILALVCVLGLVSCGQEDSLGQEEGLRQGDYAMQFFFSARVVEAHEEYLLLDVFDIGNTNLSQGAIVEVSTDVTSVYGCPEFVADEFAKVIMKRNTDDNSPERLEALFIYKTDGLSTIEGTVLEINETNILINESNYKNGECYLNVSGDTVVYVDGEKSDISMIEVGQIIKAMYTGGIEETYPSRINEVKEIIAEHLSGKQETEANTPDSGTENMEVANTEVAAVQPDISVAGFWDREGTVSLLVEDAVVVADLVEGGSWTEGTSDCLSDCLLFMDGEEIQYHSNCGTFNDTGNEKSLHLTEEQQAEVNAILEKYIALEQSLSTAPDIEEKPAQSADSSSIPQNGTIQDGKIYILGFGWVDYDGGGSEGIYADDMYENGNKIGTME